MFMKQLLFIVTCIAFVYSNLNAQTLEATVDTKIPFGSFTYYYLGGNNNVYKTSAFPSDELTLNETVVLSYNEDKDNYDIIEPETDHSGTAIILNSDSDSGDESRVDWDNLDMPKLWNSMLYFRDSLHALSFFEDIDSVFSAKNAPELSAISMDFHSYYRGYYSFWLHLSKKYEFLYSDKDFIDMQEESVSVVADPVQQLLLSDQRLVRIDDEVFYYNNLTQIVSTSLDNSEAIDELRRISQIEDFDVYDPYNGILNNPKFELPYHEIYFPYDKLPPSDINKDDISTGSGMNTVRFRSAVYPTHMVDNCDPNKKALRVVLFKAIRDYYDSNGDGVINEDDDYNWDEDPYFFNNATLSINWEDGLPVEVVTNYSTSSARVPHDYTNLGTYYPLTQLEVYISELDETLTFEDGTNSTRPEAVHFSFINNGVPCSKSPVTDYDSDQAGDYKLNSMTWISSNFWGKHFGARTQCFKKGATDPWQLKKADVISVSVDGSFRNTSCIIIKEEDGHKARTNRKEVRKSKTKNAIDDEYRYAIGNEDVKSIHYFNENQNVRNVNMVLNTCD